MNAFESVRPRGQDLPSKPPRKTARSRAPLEGSLKDLTTKLDHDDAASKKKHVESYANLELALAEKGRSNRTGSYQTPAERARIANNKAFK